MIEVRELRKSYGDFEAVRGVSFDAGPGRVVGILGPNGAGKTTILKVLTGFHGPDSGSVRVEGFDAAVDALEIKKRTGYLPETVPLYPDLTVREYLGFLADVRWIPARTRRSALGEAAEACSIRDVLDVPIEHLSKGFRQRVGLAQAILGDPPVLILDEPTTGLDPNQILETRSLIRDLGARKTVLLSTHILPDADALCSEVLILNEGLIAARGAPDRLAEAMKTEERLELLLKAGSREEILSAIFRLGAGRMDGEPEQDTPGSFRVRITAERGRAENAAESVSDWAQAEGFKILELRKERLSTEDIFARLTREDPA